jgi:hypothetical protein
MGCRGIPGAGKYQVVPGIASDGGRLIRRRYIGNVYCLFITKYFLISMIRLIINLISRISSLFFSKKYSTVPLTPIDEAAAIASVRGYLLRLGYLATDHCAQLRMSETTLNVSDAVNIEGSKTRKRYNKLRCEMLREFAKWDNQLLDRGPTSGHWNVLRNDVIAYPSGILIDAKSKY